MNKRAMLAGMILDAFPGFKFSALEIGAMPLGEIREPMHDFMEEFPSSHLYAFEPDDEMCQKLNDAAPANMSYIPKALSKENGKARLYMTENRSCYSLYEPNEDFCKLYWGMESLRAIDTMEIDVFTLDSLVESGEVTEPDTIKIDVQGARSEERRVGKECRSGGLACKSKKKMEERID